MTVVDAGASYPLASAVSLVLLASWGVLLVTRGRVRRVFAAVALLAAVGLVLTVVSGYVTLPDSANDALDGLRGRAGEDASFTGWFWTAAVCAVVAVVPAVLALRLVRSWPEMGSRYDAPVGSGTGPGGPGAEEDPAAAGVPETELELWHALDEGRDPT